MTSVAEQYDERYRLAYEQGLPALNPTAPTKDLLGMLASMVPRGGRVLDVGCGEGFVSVSLALLQYRVVGVDASATAIQKACEINSHSNVTYLTGEFPAVAADTGPFDAVIDIGCLHLQTEQEARRRYLDEVYRCLRDGGIYYLRAGQDLSTLTEGSVVRKLPKKRETIRVRFSTDGVTAWIPEPPPIASLSETEYVADLLYCGLETLSKRTFLPGLTYPLETAIIARRSWRGMR